MTREEIDAMPVMVGRMKSVWGLNGFEKAEIGHPVFEYKERYVIFLKCLTKTMEQVPDGNGGHVKTFIEFNTMIPFYKKTLEPEIEFLTKNI